MKLLGSDNGCYVNYSNSFFTNNFRIVWRGVRAVSEKSRNIPLIIAHLLAPFATFFQFIYTFFQPTAECYQLAEQTGDIRERWRGERRLTLAGGQVRSGVQWHTDNASAALQPRPYSKKA